MAPMAHSARGTPLDHAVCGGLSPALGSRASAGDSMEPSDYATVRTDDNDAKT